jgi:hypothetical protein
MLDTLWEKVSLTQVFSTLVATVILTLFGLFTEFPLAWLLTFTFNVQVWSAAVVVAPLFLLSGLWSWNRWKEYNEPEIVQRSFCHSDGPKWEFEVRVGDDVIKDSIEPYCPECETYPLKLETVASEGCGAECGGCESFDEVWLMPQHEVRDKTYRHAVMLAKDEGLI